MSTKVSSARATKRNGSFRAKRLTVCDESVMSMASGHFDTMPSVPNRPGAGERVYVRSTTHGAR